jgi:hypothetical protein
MSGQPLTLDPMRRRGPSTLAELAFVNLRAAGYGWRESFSRATDALDTASSLAIAYLKGAGTDGAWPTQAEYAEHYGITTRTAQRQWHVFREAFPDEASPERIAEIFAREYGRRLEDRGAMLSAPASLVAAT